MSDTWFTSVCQRMTWEHFLWTNASHDNNQIMIILLSVGCPSGLLLPRRPPIMKTDRRRRYLLLPLLVPASSSLPHRRVKGSRRHVFDYVESFREQTKNTPLQYFHTSRLPLEGDISLQCDTAIPSIAGLLNGREENKENGTKPESKISKVPNEP